MITDVGFDCVLWGLCGFSVEVRKQSSCAIQLANKTDHYVAFKVNNSSMIMAHLMCLIVL